MASRLSQTLLRSLRPRLRQFSAAAAAAPSVPSAGSAPPRSMTFFEDSVDTVVNTILTNAEHDKRQKEDRVVLALLVDNDPGVLNKVSGLLSARGFNIESLTVSPTNLDAMSRMTVVIRDASEEKSAQAIKQLQDVVNVLAVVDYTGTNSLHRELVMVKVAYMPQTGNGAQDQNPQSRPTYRELLDAQTHKAAVRDLGALFGAEVVDVGSRHITFQLTSWSRRVDAFIRMLEPMGIIEVARSGMVAMLRSSVTGTEKVTATTNATIDAANLPPG